MTVSPSFAPHLYNWISFILTILVVALILSPRFNFRNKSLMALSLVLVPHTSGEIFLTITNLQWLLAILLVVVLLKEAPDKKYGSLTLQITGDVLIIFFCGLTGPFILFLLPFFIFKCRKFRSYNSLLLAVAALATSVQVYCIQNDSLGTLSINKKNYVIADYAAIIGQRVFGNLFMGNFLPYQISPQVLCFMLLMLLYFIFKASGSDDGKWLFPISVFLLFAVMITGAMFFRFLTSALRPYMMNFLTPGWCERYFYVPYVMLIWSLLVCMSQNKGWKSSVARSLLAVILVSSLLSGFRAKPLPYLNWQFYSRQIESGAMTLVPINPKGWWLAIRGTN